MAFSEEKPRNNANMYRIQISSIKTTVVYFFFKKRKLLLNCFCTGANICRHDKGLLFKCVSCEIINHCVTVFENHNKESHVIGHQDVTYRRLYLFHLLVALASVHDDIACISSNKQVSPYLLHNT